MFKKNPLSVIAMIILFMVVLSGLISAQTKVNISREKSFYILLNGTFSLAQDIGSDSDYVPGVNDFPVTPSHSEYGGGLGFMFDLSDSIAFKIEGEYLLGADVEKVDPSDGETYTYKTYDNVNVIGSLVLKFGDETQFFVSGGGGINILLPYADKEETGSLGSIIIVEAPDTTMNPMAAVGAGVIFNTGSMIVKIEGQYSMIFSYEKNAILLRLGIGF
jgi:hypothetical protein